MINYVKAVQVPARTVLHVQFNILEVLNNNLAHASWVTLILNKSNASPVITHVRHAKNLPKIA